MNFDDVKAVLHAIQQSQPLPVTGLQTTLRQKSIISDEMPLRQQDDRIKSWLLNVISSQYNRVRRFHRLAPISTDMPRQQLIDYLRQDYQQSDRVLEAWSVMFVHYSGLLETLTIQEYESIAQTSERTLRRRQIYGHRLIHMHIQLC